MARVLRFCCWFMAIAIVVFGVLISRLVDQALELPVKPTTDFLVRNGIQHVVLNDGRLMEYHSAGDPDGKPVLLMQGTLQTGRTVCLLADKLFQQHHFKAICPTIPGYGYSTWSEGPMSEYPRDIEQLADQLNISKFVALAGWSGGGLPAALIAGALPDRVGQLLLVVAAPPDPSWYDYGTLGHLYLWLAAHTRINEVLVHHLIVPMLRKNCTDFFMMSGTPEEVAELAGYVPGGMAAICGDMVRAVTEHSDRAYSSIGRRWFLPVPIDWSNVARRRVDIVYAEKDSLITPLAAKRYHEAIPGSRLYQYAGATHGVAGVDLARYLGVLWGEEPLLPVVREK